MEASISQDQHHNYHVATTCEAYGPNTGPKSSPSINICGASAERCAGPENKHNNREENEENVILNHIRYKSNTTVLAKNCEDKKQFWNTYLNMIVQNFSGSLGRRFTNCHHNLNFFAILFSTDLNRR